MTDKKIQNNFEGEKFKVIHCKGAVESYEESLRHVDSQKRKSFTRSMIIQIQRLADGQRMSKENFPQEGVLPKQKEQSKTKKIQCVEKNSNKRLLLVIGCSSQYIFYKSLCIQGLR